MSYALLTASDQGASVFFGGEKIATRIGPITGHAVKGEVWHATIPYLRFPIAPKEIATMKLLARLLMAGLLTGSITATTSLAHAEEAAPVAPGEKGKATRTGLAENDKVQAFEIRQKPGEVNTPSTSATRVIRALKGGTLLRTYADGKTEKTEWKTGEVQIQEPGPQYQVKNIGKTDVVLYVVRLK